jgi:hypothetical protein
MLSASLVAAALWSASAVLAALLPRRPRARAVALLIGSGVPLLGMLTMEHGPWAGLAALASGVLILRWPICRSRRWRLARLRRLREIE